MKIDTYNVLIAALCMTVVAAGALATIVMTVFQ